MATLKDVQFSMQGEQKPSASNDLGFNFPSSLNPTPDTEGKLEYVVFKLVKKNVRKLNLDGISEGVNPKTGKVERIYLLRGASTIWQSELWDFLKDKEYYNKNRRSALFQDGICRVPTHDQTLLDFLRYNKNNVGKNRSGSGKYDFYEYNPAEEQAMRMEKQLNKIKVITKVNEMQEEAAKKLASFLGISFVDELGLPKGPDGIKTELLLRADSQPDVVIRYMDSKEVEVAWLVRKAIVDAKIDLQGQSGNALWASGKGFICKIPSSRKPYEYLTELAMTNSAEGKQFLQQLEATA